MSRISGELDMYYRCLRKYMYETKSSAKREIKKVKRKSGKRLAYYKCDYCRGYHVCKKRNKYVSYVAPVDGVPDVRA